MPSESSPTPRQLPYPHSLIVYALLSGKGKILLRLLVDTGATYTMIPQKAALAIGCDPVVAKRRIPIVTVSAVEYVPLLTIPTLACLGRPLQNVEVACHDLPPQSAVDGLLGLNVLIHFPPFRQFTEHLHSYLITP